jgi:hypothetical protein
MVPSAAEEVLPLQKCKRTNPWRYVGLHMVRTKFQVNFKLNAHIWFLFISWHLVQNFEQPNLKTPKIKHTSSKYYYFILRTWPALMFKLNSNMNTIRRSQSPRGLRHEPSSTARTLGSWIRIPLEAWMSLCVYSVFLLSCVQVAALRRADPPPKGSYRVKIKKLEKRIKVQQRAVEPQIDGWIQSCSHT